VVFFSKSTAEKISGYTTTLQGEYLLPKMASTLPFVIKKVISLAFPMDTEKAKEITAHSFRHSFATSWLQNNRHPVVLKKLMGWQSLNMLNVYEHLQVGKLQQEYNIFLKKR
jgi:site-specific recombinase XerD